VLEIQMDEMRRDEAPPLTAGDRRPLVTQCRPTPFARQLRQQQHSANDQQRDSIFPVAVERREQRLEPVQRTFDVHLL
jgi:hypothetical protein